MIAGEKIEVTNNPFTPVFGRIPAHLAGRKQIIADMVQAFGQGAGNPNLSSIFVGSRGTGKTALLSYLGAEASSRGWIAVDVTAMPGMLDDILQRVQEEAAHLLEPSQKRRLSSVEISSLGSVTWDNLPDAPLNWRSKMNLLFDQLERTNTGILISVDEVDPSLDEMVQLAVIYQHFVRENKKTALLMAGLPHNVSSLISGKSTSFLRRASRHNLGLISDEEIAEAFEITLMQGGKSIESKALDEAVEAIKGFPFMFQLVGYRVWELSEGGMVTSADVREGAKVAQKELKSRVYDATIRELSPADIDFLVAMLPDEVASSTVDLAQRLGRSSAHVSTYKRRLLESGVIEETLRGKLKFCLPGFREYLDEIKDTD